MWCQAEVFGREAGARAGEHPFLVSKADGECKWRREFFQADALPQLESEAEFAAILAVAQVDAVRTVRAVALVASRTRRAQLPRCIPLPVVGHLGLMGAQGDTIVAVVQPDAQAGGRERRQIGVLAYGEAGGDAHAAGVAPRGVVAQRNARISSLASGRLAI